MAVYLVTLMAQRNPLHQDRRQLHVWLSEADYAFLESISASRDETIAAFVRRVIKSLRAANKTLQGQSQPEAEK